VIFKSQNAFQIIQGSAPDPTRGAYSAPPDPLAGGEGVAKNPSPAYLKRQPCSRTQHPHFLFHDTIYSNIRMLYDFHLMVNSK